MWPWKYSISLVLFYATVTSVFIEIKHYFNPKNQNHEQIQIDCFDPSGDSSVICYFAEKLMQNSHLNISRIHTSGNFSIENIRLMTNIGFHKYNMPEYMPGNIGILFPNIEELYITHSSLKYLIRYCFKYMKNIQILDLDNNEIESIPDDTFYDLQNLVFLKLNGNKIKTLKPPLLNHLHKLHTFSAVKNQITQINIKFFRFNGKIKWIYLYGNKIEKFVVNFQRFKHLKAVDLRQNPNNCNFLFNVNLRNNYTVENFQRNVTKFCNVKYEK